MTNENRDRDASIDRLLPGTLEARAGAAPGRACLDAETLAGWADEALDARERAAAEAHAADCGRCRALLAAMVRTLPPRTAATSPSRPRSLWWLAALTPVAAALVVWFAVPDRAPVQQSADPAAAVEQMVPASPAASPVDARAKAQPEFRAETPGRALAKENDAPALDRKASPPAGANAASDVSAIAAVPAAGAAPVAPPASIAESSLRREALSASARTNDVAGSLDIVVVSSNPSTRFRLLPGGGVQRTADAGATWRTEVTGATETLTGGASPSPSVCWLIGPSGTVLLSTDGRSWRRVAFPEAAALRTVTATDGENATVTAVDGRAFTTTDGGRTWSRVPDF